MVLGSSRAAQGVIPTVLDKVLSSDLYDGELFNFSFTRDNSPYGPAYLGAIVKKLDKNSTNGLYILAVDPWVLSMPIGITDFPENDMQPGNMSNVTSNPNLEYLIRNYNYAWGSLIGGPFSTKDTVQFLHDDGWLEINVPMDSISMALRFSRKLKEYEDLATKEMEYSIERVLYLEKTINYLKPYGKVVLVRIPMDAGIRSIEDQFRPDFSAEMDELAKKHNVLYVDDTDNNEKYDYTDGNHLAATSAPLYSGWLANYIKRSSDPN